MFEDFSRGPRLNPDQIHSWKEQTMPEHSPEPPNPLEWLTSPVTDDGAGYLLLKSPAGATATFTVDQRSRVASCLNFCRHQSTEFLQSHRMVPIKSKDDITTDKSRSGDCEFHPAILVAVVAEAAFTKGKVDAQS